MIKHIILIAIILLTPLSADAQPESPFAGQDYSASNMENFSKLYWGMNMLDINNDVHIDNYMLINECDIYTDYFHHEFEWRSVRESARQYIMDNVGQFPVHFEFMQPLKLGEYDFEAGSFAVLKDYQILDMRRFEVVAPPAELRSICGRKRSLEGYPKALVLDFNRPLRLTDVAVEEGLASRFITGNLGGIRQMGERFQTRERVHNARDAYIVYKAKIVGFKDVDLGGKYDRAQFIAIVDGYEIYADQYRRVLLSAQDFRRDKREFEVNKESGATLLESVQ